MARLVPGGPAAHTPGGCCAGNRRDGAGTGRQHSVVGRASSAAAAGALCALTASLLRSALPVRITRDGYHDKGPNLSREINLVGQNLVGLLGPGGVRFSKRIAADVDRERLAALVAPIIAAGQGVIVRRSAAETGLAPGSPCKPGR